MDTPDIGRLDPFPEVGEIAGPAAPRIPGGRGRRVFRNTILNGAGFGFTLAMGFLLVPFFIGHLGKSAYGVYVLALSFSLTGGYLSLSDIGLTDSIVRFVALKDGSGEREGVNEIVSSALVVLLAMGLVAISLAGAVALLVPHLFKVPLNLQFSLRFLFVLVGVEAAVGLCGLAFQGLLAGLQRYGTIRLVDGSRQVVFIIMVVTALLSHRGVVSIGVAALVSTSVGTVSYYGAARKVLPGFRVSYRLIQRTTLRHLMGFGGWIFLAKASGVIWQQMDKVILATFFATALLASYDVAAKIAGAAGVVLSLTSSALMPAASALAATKDREGLRELLFRGTRYTLALGLPLMLGAGVMAKPLIVHWVGSSFASAAGPARMFLAYQLLAAAVAISQNMLIGIGRVKRATLYALGSVTLNLALSILLAPRYGIRGVISGTLIAYGIAAPFYIHLILKDLRQTWRAFAAATVIPLAPWGIVFAAVVWATERAIPPANIPAVFLLCIPAFLIYLGGVARFAMNSAERRMLTGFVFSGWRPSRARGPSA